MRSHLQDKGPGTIRLIWLSLFFLAAISATLTACKKTSTTTSAPVETVETYTPIAGAVEFDILPLQGNEDLVSWMAAYTDEGRTTRFRIEFGPRTSSEEKGVQLSEGQGKFLTEKDSDPLPLLESLEKALRAKRLPAKVQKVDELPFDYVVLGENQTRSADGSFSDKPGGNWTAMKLSLAKGKGEVFLNLNPAMHKAEFSIKDGGSGDIVVGELAKVF
jgi:hypothetical protein